MSRQLATTAALALALATQLAPAAAHAEPAPVATGTLRAPSTNAAWGTFEVFTTSSNSFGFWLRFREPNGHILTVMPGKFTADGQLDCSYIEYSLTGAVNPSQAQGWQFQEVAGGKVLLNPATATATTIDGSMAENYQMIGYSRQTDINIQFTPIRLSVP